MLITKLKNTYKLKLTKKFHRVMVNPIWGGGLEGPPLMNILSHFSCVKAMDLKFLDFLSFSITQLLEKKYFEYVDPGGHRSSSKSR